MRKFQQRDDIMIYLAKVVDFYWKHIVLDIDKYSDFRLGVEMGLGAGV